MKHRPIVGITMGDAAGIGPEIIVKALMDTAVYNQCRPVVIGDLKILAGAIRLLQAECRLHKISSVQEAALRYGTIDCLDLDLLPPDLPIGQVDARAGDAAFRFVEKAVNLALRHEIDAICTAPLSKEAMHLGGHSYPGHTEILATLTGTQDYAMMLSAPKLKVIHVTTHVGLIDAIRNINPQRVYNTIKLAHDVLQSAGYEKPRIAICGINPHAGEQGLFGYGEEEEKIIPAVNRAVVEGIHAIGPLPADTLFYRAVRGDFDIVVAMYHDQGHGPIKVLGLESGVNITVGLPIIRTSVDHGTAFDIAGQGIADERSMKEALLQAAAFASYPKPD